MEELQLPVETTWEFKTRGTCGDPHSWRGRSSQHGPSSMAERRFHGAAAATPLVPVPTAKQMLVRAVALVSQPRGSRSCGGGLLEAAVSSWLRLRAGGGTNGGGGKQVLD